MKTAVFPTKEVCSENTL